MIILVSCEPDELPVDSKGLITTAQIDIGEDYCYQKYYNIDENIVVGENLITAWDLAFHNTNNIIMLNSSKKMRVINIDNLNIDDPASLFPNKILEVDTTYYDNPNGEVESLAFNNGQDELFKGYFLIDKGYDCNTSNNQHLGYVVINIIDYDENKYFIQIAEDNFTVFQNFEILKRKTDDYSYFSFITNDIVNIRNFSWDLCFSQYTEFNVPAPNNSDLKGIYRVRGFLQNSHVSVAVDNNNSFSDITINMIDDYQFSFNQNAIGYNWKYYNNDTQTYSIDSPVYLIKTSDNDYYKLLFLDYYNDNGEKGAPLFQIEKL